MSFGYGYFIEEEEFLNIRAKAKGITVNELILDSLSLYIKQNMTDPIDYWKNKNGLGDDEFARMVNRIEVTVTYLYYLDDYHNKRNTLLFIGETFDLNNTIRYSQFFQFVEENKQKFNIDKVNQEIKNNGFDPNLCDFHLLCRYGNSLIYKGEETNKL
jgi:hypothetical protein